VDLEGLYGLTYYNNGKFIFFVRKGKVFNFIPDFIFNIKSKPSAE